MTLVTLPSGVQVRLDACRPDVPAHNDPLLWRVQDQRPPSATRTPIHIFAEAPSAVDLRSICSQVEVQGTLGSCTAHAVTSLMESLYLREGRPLVQLSRLYLYYATRVWRARQPPETDLGATLRDTIKAAEDFGVCPEDAWPYNMQRWASAPSLEARAAARNHDVTYAVRCADPHGNSDLEMIRACLAERWPCAFGFALPENALSHGAASSGLIRFPAQDEQIAGWHAVLAVGYDDAKQALLCRNSWGRAWGLDGDFWLPYNFVHNQLARDFWSVRRERFIDAIPPPAAPPPPL